VRGSGGTKNHTGFENALWLLQNRRAANPVCCIFLVTDGADNNVHAYVRCQALMQKYVMPQSYIVNYYGYSDDHNSDVLTKIAK
jgi:hypothetical protein